MSPYLALAYVTALLVLDQAVLRRWRRKRDAAVAKQRVVELAAIDQAQREDELESLRAEANAALASIGLDETAFAVEDEDEAPYDLTNFDR